MSFNYNIAGAGGLPNVLSEIAWKDVQSVAVYGDRTFSLTPSTFFFVEGSYGEVYRGKAIDIDYLGNNRTLIEARAVSKGNEGHHWDVLGGLAYNYGSFTPMVGYGGFRQRYYMIGGAVVESVNPAFLGPIDGLQSRYKATWHGAFVGAKLHSGCVEVGARGYRLLLAGRGRWNLRDDFLNDFHHSARGFGTESYLKVLFDLGGEMQATVFASYKTFSTAKGVYSVKVGIDNLPPGDDVGTLPILSQSSLNEVNWHEFSLGVQLRACF